MQILQIYLKTKLLKYTGIHKKGNTGIHKKGNVVTESTVDQLYVVMQGGEPPLRTDKQRKQGQCPQCIKKNKKIFHFFIKKIPYNNIK